MRRLVVVLLLAGLTAGPRATLAQSPAPVSALLEQHLYTGALEAGESALQSLVEREPQNADARFALGGVKVIRAVERFGQGLYRHGLEAPTMTLVPLFGLPLPVNPRPEPLTYDKFRAMLARLVDDLDAADSELARIGGAPVKLSVDLARIRLDLDANGVAEERERLSAVIDSLAQAARRRALPATAAAGDRFPVTFDTADVYWLRGYVNLLAVSAEFFLAHDFRAAFDTTFQFLFPRAGLPGARLFEERMQGQRNEVGSILDAIAFIHLVRWEVTEPRRMAAIHGRLKQVVALSRQTWAAVLAETDDDDEWLPSPTQKGVLDMPVTADMLTAWHAMLDEFEAVLDGRKLVPHPRFARGINMRKIFLEPRHFDLVLWVTGHGVLPFLEDGPIIDGDSWNQASRAFGGYLLTYAFWFN